MVLYYAKINAVLLLHILHTISYLANWWIYSPFHIIERKPYHRVVMCVTNSAWKRCSVYLYLQLFVGVLMSYLRYLCLFAHSGVQHILCCVFVLFFSVLCIYHDEIKLYWMGWWWWCPLYTRQRRLVRC